MLRLFTLPFIVLLHAWIVSAQFQFFEQMFGGHPGQHQQQHQQQQRPSGASYYAAQADSSMSKKYYLWRV